MAPGYISLLSTFNTRGSLAAVDTTIGIAIHAGWFNYVEIDAFIVQ
ncbi:MAG TPA: hypothetical protein VG675_25190 [Bryobacteraceae bacterium]|nr:hypothetical protein [Bryobacteraceae bacterium]